MRIAHITDSHLLEPEPRRRSGRHRWRVEFLSFGRALDAEDRRRRLSSALLEARAYGAEHFVLTGDLTEDGLMPQFEALSEVLWESGIDPERVTLVPGNHDLYTDQQAWDLACAGPLAPWAQSSRLGSLLVRGQAAVLPISTVFKQHYLFSGGRLGADNAYRIRWAAKQARSLGCALVVAQHHPVFPHAVSVGTWWDGLRDHATMTTLLEQHPETVVFHGHIHKEVSRRVGSNLHAQVFSARATVDSDVPLRLYDVQDGMMKPVELDQRGASVAPDLAIAAE